MPTGESAIDDSFGRFTATERDVLVPVTLFGSDRPNVLEVLALSQSALNKARGLAPDGASDALEQDPSGEALPTSESSVFLVPPEGESVRARVSKPAQAPADEHHAAIWWRFGRAEGLDAPPATATRARRLAGGVKASWGPWGSGVRVAFAASASDEAAAFDLLQERALRENAFAKVCQSSIKDAKSKIAKVLAGAKTRVEEAEARGAQSVRDALQGVLARVQSVEAAVLGRDAVAAGEDEEAGGAIERSLAAIQKAVASMEVDREDRERDSRIVAANLREAEGTIERLKASMDKTSKAAEEDARKAREDSDSAVADAVRRTEAAQAASDRMLVELGEAQREGARLAEELEDERAARAALERERKEMAEEIHRLEVEAGAVREDAERESQEAAAAREEAEKMAGEAAAAREEAEKKAGEAAAAREEAEKKAGEAAAAREEAEKKAGEAAAARDQAVVEADRIRKEKAALASELLAFKHEHPYTLQAFKEETALRRKKQGELEEASAHLQVCLKALQLRDRVLFESVKRQLESTRSSADADAAAALAVDEGSRSPAASAAATPPPRESIPTA